MKDSYQSNLYYFYFVIPMNTQIILPHSSLQNRFISNPSLLKPLESNSGWQNEDKSEDIFFKSQVSLAETCQDEPPRSHSFQGDIFDEDCLSMDSQNFCQSSSEVEICQDFLLRGHCMKGKSCGWTHFTIPGQQQGIKRQRRLRLRIWEEIPDICLARCNRANSFLN